jgi:hypothetical protein
VTAVAMAAAALRGTTGHLPGDLRGGVQGPVSGARHRLHAPVSTLANTQCVHSSYIPTVYRYKYSTWLRRSTRTSFRRAASHTLTGEWSIYLVCHVLGVIFEVSYLHSLCVQDASPWHRRHAPVIVLLYEYTRVINAACSILGALEYKQWIPPSTLQ